jgi:hypothetical protein
MMNSTFYEFINFNSGKRGMAHNETTTPNKICPDSGISFFSFLHRLQREGAAVGGSQLSAQMVV